jgi:hypothetical protein
VEVTLFFRGNGDMRRFMKTLCERFLAHLDDNPGYPIGRRAANAPVGFLLAGRGGRGYSRGQCGARRAKGWPAAPHRSRLVSFAGWVVAVGHPTQQEGRRSKPATPFLPVAVLSGMDTAPGTTASQSGTRWAGYRSIAARMACCVSAPG